MTLVALHVPLILYRCESVTYIYFCISFIPGIHFCIPFIPGILHVPNSFYPLH